MPATRTAFQHPYKLFAILFASICMLVLLLVRPSVTPIFDVSARNGHQHIVMFQFKPETKMEDIQVACDRMLALKYNCLDPNTNKPYVKSIIGGKDNSPEGLQNGITHAFIVEFNQDADRQYYLKRDPAHLAFSKSIGDLLVKAQVIDFSPGSF